MLGAIGAVVATQSGESNLEDVFVWSALIAAMLRFATPLAFAALGGILSERSGVINIGLEGMMLMGAFFGIFGADVTGSWFLGALIGMASGGGHGPRARGHSRSRCAPTRWWAARPSTSWRSGITGYVFVDHYGARGTPSDVPRVAGRDACPGSSRSPSSATRSARPTSSPGSCCCSCR